MPEAAGSIAPSLPGARVSGELALGCLLPPPGRQRGLGPARHPQRGPGSLAALNRGDLAPQVTRSSRCWSAWRPPRPGHKPASRNASWTGPELAAAAAPRGDLLFRCTLANWKRHFALSRWTIGSHAGSVRPAAADPGAAETLLPLTKLRWAASHGTRSIEASYRLRHQCAVQPLLLLLISGSSRQLSLCGQRPARWSEQRRSSAFAAFHHILDVCQPQGTTQDQPDRVASPRSFRTCWPAREPTQGATSLRGRDSHAAA